MCILQTLDQTIEREGRNLQSTSMYVMKCLEEYITQHDASVARELQILRSTFDQMFQSIDSLKSIIRKRLQYPQYPPPENEIERNEQV